MPHFDWCCNKRRLDITITLCTELSSTYFLHRGLVTNYREGGGATKWEVGGM